MSFFITYFCSFIFDNAGDDVSITLENGMYTFIVHAENFHGSFSDRWREYSNYNTDTSPRHNTKRGGWPHPFTHPSGVVLLFLGLHIRLPRRERWYWQERTARSKCYSLVILNWWENLYTLCLNLNQSPNMTHHFQRSGLNVYMLMISGFWDILQSGHPSPTERWTWSGTIQSESIFGRGRRAGSRSSRL